MERRGFIEKSFAVSSIFVLGSQVGLASMASETNAFNLLYAPHFGMFKNNAGDNLMDQLQFIHEQGFKALEDNGMKYRSVDEQNKIAQKMQALEMKMGVFVAHKIYWKEANLTSGDKVYREEFLKHIMESVEVAKRVNAKWMTVVPGHVDLGLEMGYQTANVIESLRRACDILEPHDLVMVLEPLNWWANHAGMFLNKIPQAYQICRAVDSPSCKILFDIYHQQVHEGNIISNIEKAWDEIAYFQVGDNPGRKEPTTGEINYFNIFKYLHSRGFAGIIGMEHGNAQPGKKGEENVIDAYRKIDGFI